MESEQNGQAQTAYRILAASSEQRLAAGQGDLWDSGVVSSAETLHVPYAGTKLASRQRCYWRVQVWDRDGTPAGTSEIAWFEMGLLEPGDWQKATGSRAASPSLAAAAPRVHPARTRGLARLYLCGQGAYEASINGQPVSDQVLGPTLSYFSKRMLYDTFDVTVAAAAGGQRDRRLAGTRLVWRPDDLAEDANAGQAECFPEPAQCLAGAT